MRTCNEDGEERESFIYFNRFFLISRLHILELYVEVLETIWVHLKRLSLELVTCPGWNYLIKVKIHLNGYVDVQRIESDVGSLLKNATKR